MGSGLRAVCAAIVCAAALAAAAGAGSARQGSPQLAAYRGLATWVDMYDPKSWANPEAAVAAMAGRGVRTLFLETSNYSRSYRLHEPDRIARFIEAAHAQGMSIVAWYLPDLAHPRHDLARSLAAVGFRTPLGEGFDSFALDIEASVVRNVELRNARLLALSRNIRSAVGPSYPLGAIIPSPRGMHRLPKYWPGFPYRELAGAYDVFLPMDYYSYHPRDLAGAFGYTARNVTLIREETGLAQVPVHPIGGLAGGSSTEQVHNFVRAARACGAVGASLYDFSTTRAMQWKWLARAPVGIRTPQPSCS